MKDTKARKLIQSRIVGHEEVDPKQLLANPLNFRRHPGEQKAALRGSLKELGWIKETIVNKRTGHTLDGHARIEEALAQGVKVPVTWVDLSLEEERLALAVLDPITEMAKQDDQALADLLAEVETEDEALRAMLMEMDPGAEKPVTVKEVDVDEVQDRFWISIQGPLPQQLDALEKIRLALESLGPEVVVDVGTTNG